MEKPNKTHTASLLRVLALGLLMAPGLEAQEKNCDALMSALSRGEMPLIVTNPADGTVKTVTSQGACSETIEAFSNGDFRPSGQKKPAKSRPPSRAQGRTEGGRGNPETRLGRTGVLQGINAKTNLYSGDGHRTGTKNPRSPAACDCA